MHGFSIKSESIHIPYAGLAAIMLTLGLLVIAAPANAQSEPASGPPQENLAALGKKLTDPLSDVWALFTEFDATWSEGDFSNGDHRTGSRMLFQPILPIPLTENWKVLARPIVPIMFSQDVPTGRRYDSSESTDGTTVILKPDGSATFDSKDGMGDIKLPLLFSPVQKPGALGWGWGAGPTFQFPTATDDSLGTDTWEAGPAAVLTYKRKGFMAAAFGQYWWNFAETNSRATDTSHGSLLYVAYWDLPRTWQIGFSPTITYNNKATSGNKWNVPIGVTVAKMHKFGKLPVKFQFAIEKSIVREDDFGLDWNVRLNIIPVIPSLVKEPLF